MELKDVLGEIEADSANLVHGRLLEWALTPPLWHAEAVGGCPHHHARLVHTRSRAARQRPMQGGALHHRAFCVNFWIESLPGSLMACRCERRQVGGQCTQEKEQGREPAVLVYVTGADRPQGIVLSGSRSKLTK